MINLGHNAVLFLISLGYAFKSVSIHQDDILDFLGAQVKI